MTTREYCEAMLISYEHPETWDDAARDRFLRWRLAHSAAFWRLRRAGWLAGPDDFRVAMAHAIRESVIVLLEERAHLYRQRYSRCDCERCRPPQPHQNSVYAAMAQLDDEIRQRRIAAAHVTA